MLCAFAYYSRVEEKKTTKTKMNTFNRVLRQ